MEVNDRVKIKSRYFSGGGKIKSIYRDMATVRLDRPAPSEFAKNTREIVVGLDCLEVEK